MSRSGYCDDIDDQWAHIRWRGMVASSIRGKRGQSFLKDLLKALDEMPEKRLLAEVLQSDGGVCALGCVGKKRGIDMTNLDTDDDETTELVASQLDIADCLAREIVFENDEGGWNETPEQRFERVRKWVASQIKPETAQPESGTKI